MSNRRNFLKVAGAASMFPAVSSGAEVQANNAVQQYARLGRTDLKISDISFGTSRLREGMEDVVAFALDRGINYFDSAEGYTGGDSEKVLGRALAGKRDQVYIVSKSILSAKTSAQTMMRSLEESLVRLNTDYVDVYMNHAVNDVDVVANPEWLAFVEQAKQQGKIRFSGLSGHGGYLIDCLDFALDEDMVDVVLTAFNFGQDPKFYEGLTRGLDWIATQPDLPRVLAKAKQKDVGVVAMKTLHGARLNDMRPYEKGGATFAQAAFKWVLGHDSVDALVVTMTEKSQVDEYLGASGQTAIATHDRRLLERYAQMQSGTACKYACNTCESSCPYNVSIPDVMRTRMYATDYGDVEFARDEYALIAADASPCLSCSGEPCKGACPHGIQVHELCTPTHNMLA